MTGMTVHFDGFDEVPSGQKVEQNAAPACRDANGGGARPAWRWCARGRA